jgi:hypothetical protein
VLAWTRSPSHITQMRSAPDTVDTRWNCLDRLQTRTDRPRESRGQGSCWPGHKPSRGSLMLPSGMTVLHYVAPVKSASLRLAPDSSVPVRLRPIAVG